MNLSAALSCILPRAPSPCAQGPGNRHSADTVFNMGVTAQLSGDWRAALPHFERALRAYRAHLAADHPAIARAEERIAMCRAEL